MDYIILRQIAYILLYHIHVALFCKHRCLFLGVRHVTTLLSRLHTIFSYNGIIRLITFSNYCQNAVQNSCFVISSSTFFMIEREGRPNINILHQNVTIRLRDIQFQLMFNDCKKLENYNKGLEAFESSINNTCYTRENCFDFNEFINVVDGKATVTSY